MARRLALSYLIAVLVGLATSILMLGATVAETLTIPIDRTELLRIDRPASVVVVGQSAIADVQVESPRLVLVVGKGIGETNLIILDSQGAEIVRYDVVVVPAAEGQVTIFHGGTGVSTMSCNPRCAAVRNPGGEREPQQGRGAATGGVPLTSPAAGTGVAAEGPAGEPTHPVQILPRQPTLIPGATIEQGPGSSAGKRGY